MEEQVREQVEEVVVRAMRTVNSLRESQHFLARSEAAVEYWRQSAARLARERDSQTEELKALEFRDIGHARGELEKQCKLEKQQCKW
jgi:hypothetical protein